jgi:hypothetical protein
MHPRTFLDGLRLAFRTATALENNQLVVDLDRDTLNGIVGAAWLTGRCPRPGRLRR